MDFAQVDTYTSVPPPEPEIRPVAHSRDRRYTGTPVTDPTDLNTFQRQFATAIDNEYARWTSCGKSTRSRLNGLRQSRGYANVFDEPR